MILYESYKIFYFFELKILTRVMGSFSLAEVFNTIPVENVLRFQTLLKIIKFADASQNIHLIKRLETYVCIFCFVCFLLI